MKTKKLDLKKEIKNLKNIISLKCFDCVCCQPLEIAKCDITGCPLWEIRPKKLKGLYTLVKVLKEKNPEFYEANN